MSVAQIPFSSKENFDACPKEPDLFNDCQKEKNRRDILDYLSQTTGAGAGLPGSRVVNFQEPVHSFSTMLLTRRGNLLEHATFLCSLFLSKGINAYVAIGKVKSKPYAWVVTIEPNNSPVFREDNEESIIEFPHLQYRSGDDLRFSEGITLCFEKSAFSKHSTFNSTQRDRELLKVVHWDSISGSCFSRVDESGFIFERVETLFNHEHLFFNVQKSDNVKR